MISYSQKLLKKLGSIANMKKKIKVKTNLTKKNKKKFAKKLGEELLIFVK